MSVDVLAYAQTLTRYFAHCTTDAARKEWFTARTVPEPNTGCWLWLGGMSGWGYPLCSKRSRKAHRLSYEMFNGPIPEGFDVLHKCDTPMCVNPQHLEVGTPAKNIGDAWKRRRGKMRIVVREVEAFGRTQSVSEWSRETGVASHTIKSRLDRGWKPEYAVTVVRNSGHRDNNPEYMQAAS